MAKCPSRTSTGCGGGGGGGGGRGESGGNWDENDSDNVEAGTVLAVSRRRSNGPRSRQSDLPGPCSVCRTLHGQARNEQARLFNLGCVRQTANCIRGYSKTKGRSSELCACRHYHKRRLTDEEAAAAEAEASVETELGQEPSWHWQDPGNHNTEPLIKLLLIGNTN